MSEYVLRGWVQNPMGEALPGISVAILTQPADSSTQPGSPLATLYAAASFNTATVSAASWSAGQITFTLTAPPPSDVVAGSFIFVTGVSPTGYNTTISAPWEVVSTSGNNVVVTALTNPGTYSSGGSVATSAWPNPTTTDGNGYWFGYADPGFYTVQQYGASLSSQLIYPDWQNALSASGTVTAVALTAPGEITVAGSPVTSSGTIALTWTNEAQNLVLASPTGGSGTPTFRALALSDLPASFGTVSSIGFTSTVPTFLIASVSGSPVTSTGTISLALSLATQSANNFFAGPTSGGAAAPTFRPMAIADLPATGTASSSTFLRGDGTWASATGTGGGTVTSVAMTGDGTVFNSTVSGSPITSSGTLAPALLTQTANYVFAGPTSGSASAPTFRTLVIADLPATGSPSSATFLRGDGTWASPTGSGTVTSVSMSGDGTVFNASVSGSPITGSGTLAPSLKSQSANVVLAGPTSGGSAAPTFRALVSADLPAIATPLKVENFDVTVVSYNNSAAEHTLMTFTLSANELGSSQWLDIIGRGTLANTTGSSQNFTIKLYLDSNVVLTTTPFIINGTTYGWVVRGQYALVTSGASGTAECQADFCSSGGTSYASPNTSTFSFDTTATHVIKITMTLGTASALLSAAQRMMLITRVG